MPVSLSYYLKTNVTIKIKLYTHEMPVFRQSLKANEYILGIACDH